MPPIRKFVRLLESHEHNPDMKVSMSLADILSLSRDALNFINPPYESSEEQETFFTDEFLRKYGMPSKYDFKPKAHSFYKQIRHKFTSGNSNVPDHVADDMFIEVNQENDLNRVIDLHT